MTRLRILAIGLLMGACGGTTNSGTDIDAGNTAVTGTTHHFVSSDITLPTTTTQSTNFGFNLDNDSQGRVDNALGSLLQTLASPSTGADLQTPLTNAVKAGSVVILHSLRAMDPQPGTAQNASWQVFLGSKTTTPPNFDGNDTFTVDPNSPTDAIVFGPITAGGHITAGPGKIPLQLSLVSDQPPLSVTLQCAHIDATVNSDGSITGKLGGGITNEDVQNNVLPNLADLMETRATECCGPVSGVSACDAATNSNCIANPTCTSEAAANNFTHCDSSAKTILQIFDKTEAGCDASQCVQNGHITHDEVKFNSFVTSLLAPDVDLLNSAGDCAPTPITDSSADPDCISLGIGFEGVAANFQTNEAP